jgi:hypothetical protein
VYIKSRLEYIKKLESVKERLDKRAEDEKDKFLKNIEKKEKAHHKVKELQEYDEYERQRKRSIEE